MNEYSLAKVQYSNNLSDMSLIKPIQMGAVSVITKQLTTITLVNMGEPSFFLKCK